MGQAACSRGRGRVSSPALFTPSPSLPHTDEPTSRGARKALYCVVHATMGLGFYVIVAIWRVAQMVYCSSPLVSLEKPAGRGLLLFSHGQLGEDPEPETPIYSEFFGAAVGHEAWKSRRNSSFYFFSGISCVPSEFPWTTWPSVPSPPFPVYPIPFYPLPYSTLPYPVLPVGAARSEGREASSEVHESFL